jgi:hypothetical protein
MQQKLSIIVFIAGLAAFFYFGQEVLAKHTDWNSFSTPVGMSDIFGVGLGVTGAVGGALGINITGIVKSMRKQ